MSPFTTNPSAQVYLYDSPCSMSYGFPKLQELVVKSMKKKPDSKDLYLFINKKQNYLKVLYYRRVSWCMHLEKLPKGIFNAEGQGKSMSLKELRELLNDVIVNGAKQVRALKAA